METHIEWTAPAPLWDHFNGPTSANQRRIFRTPAIVRLASDTFMDDFIALMRTDAHRLTEILATPETWRSPVTELAVTKPRTGLVGQLDRARTAAVRKLEARAAVVRTAVWNVAPAEKPLKLFQPAHQRYYLVLACLVCRTLGLPDRPLDTTKQEKVTFVIRMLQPRGGVAVNPDPLLCDELALVAGEWKQLTDAQSLMEGEEQHALSPLSYAEIDGRKRRLFNGLIPVARRESLVNARRPRAGGGTPAAPIDDRQMKLKQEVLGPWKTLEDVAALASKQNASAGSSRTPTATETQNTIDRANQQIQMVAWYILLDFAKWIEANIKALWNAITNNSPAGLTTELPAFNAIVAYQWNGISLRSALDEIRKHGNEAKLEAVKTLFRGASSEWPSLSFQFVTAGTSAPASQKTTREDLEAKLAAALPQIVALAPPSNAAQVGAADYASPWFAIRCVFERPNCATLSPPVVSDPSASFQLGSFFDPDAPARPIRVTMPVDTTPAGLRKFDKNTAFVLSDVLCGQVSAVRDLTFADLIMSVLPWPLHQDLNIGGMRPCPADGGGSAGMVCSMSIPIITICALLLLMIIVKLLDIVFYWMPFFQICLPVPKFDAKKES